ncbi:hypothetical protein CU048_10435 [Beijerinckiaceae bacterium]|nr:hypothetical protein CU048_10435 [Beijerinckiaceae bacterium]
MSVFARARLPRRQVDWIWASHELWPRACRHAWTGREDKDLCGGVVCRTDTTRTGLYLVRQASAKSSQVLSTAVPARFMFCHSRPHACIRARDAGGSFRGCSNPSVGVG